jgi:hypothetical protein
MIGPELVISIVDVPKSIDPYKLFPAENGLEFDNVMVDDPRLDDAKALEAPIN